MAKETTAEYQATRYYWMKTDLTGYREHVFSRKKFFAKEFPQLSYGSFTSHLLRKCGVKVGELSREGIKEHVSNWAPKKPRGMNAQIKGNG